MANLDITTLTAKASPATTDTVILIDNAASGTLKNSTVAQLIGAAPPQAHNQTASTISDFTTATQTVPLPTTVVASIGTSTSQTEKYVTDGFQRGPMIWVPSSQWVALNGGIADAKYFGVKADGTTNDTAALQDAIDALSSITVPGLNYQNSSGTFQAGSAAPGAGILELPYGTMQITSLVGKHRLTMRGKGDGTLFRQIASTTGHMIYNRRDGTAHASYIRLQNFQMDGNKANQTNANYGIFLQGDATNTYNSPLDEDYDIRCRVENVYIRNTKGDGLRMEGAGGNFISGVFVRNADGNGIYAFQDNNISHCDVGWSGLAGVYIAGDSCRITNVKSWFSGQVTAASGRGFYLTADEGVMAGCTTQDNKAQGYLFDGAFNWSAHALSAQQNSTSSAGTYAAYDFFGSSFCQVYGSASNRYNGAATPNTGSLVAKHDTTSNYNDIRLVAGRTVWGTSVALAAGSVKNSSVVFVNNSDVVAGSTV